MLRARDAEPDGERQLRLPSHPPEEHPDLFGERLFGSGEVLWLGTEPLDEFLMKREGLPRDVSIIYGLIEER